MEKMKWGEKVVEEIYRFKNHEQKLPAIDVQLVAWKSGKVGLKITNYIGNPIHYETKIISFYNKTGVYNTFTFIIPKLDCLFTTLNKIRPFKKEAVYNPKILKNQDTVIISMLKNNERFREENPFRIPASLDTAYANTSNNKITSDFRRILLLKDSISGNTYVYILSLHNQRFVLIKRKYGIMMYAKPLIFTNKESKNVEIYDVKSLIDKSKNIDESALEY